jgi:ABC-type amino acid transport substrate-binding protein
MTHYALLTSLTRMLLLTYCFMLPSTSFSADTEVSYYVLAETVEPLMITKDGDPMAGGLFTDIVKHVFDESTYVVMPIVMPWQRMKDELKNGDNWITYGFKEGFEPGIPFELSDLPIFPFNHVAATLTETYFAIQKPTDLYGRTVILVENFHYPGLDEHLTNPVAGNGSGDVRSIRAFTPKGSLSMLKHKRGDVVFDWLGRLIYNLPAAGLTLEDVRFQDASEIIPTKKMYFAYSSHWSDSFKEFINTRLHVLQENGTLEALLQHYIGPEDLLK